MLVLRFLPLPQSSREHNHPLRIEEGLGGCGEDVGGRRRREAQGVGRGHDG